ncbi:MAG: fasciclin domain-containing protein [Anaerolineaceae bacterium]|jgi:transforming growth factor-beta-induced protein|nr:fasciclin domain-containing protein [Anaerolineaceae bacterium]
MKAFRLSSLLIVFALVLAACAPAAPAEPTEMPMPEPTAVPTEEPSAVPSNTIVDIAVGNPDFSTLVAALGAADLVDALSGEGPFTVFAPTNEAFAKLPEGTLDELLLPENKQKLTDILLYHVVSGSVLAADVVTLSEAETLLGQNVAITVDMDKVMVNEANVVATDIIADNGVIHVIDSVILPKSDIVDTAIADGRFTTLAAALGAADLVETLKGEGPFTVFAPTDDAFAALPEGTVETLLLPENKQKLTDILLYHVVAGKVMAADVVTLTEAETVLGQDVAIKVDMGKVYINDAEVIITDIVTSNGVIHVIDAVLLPKADIVDTAIEDGRFTTLAAALGAADLVETLKGEGPFTVFAPTDDAFAKLPAGTVESLLLPENKQKLTDILLYHVVSGKVMAADVVTLSEAETVLGQNVTITVKDGKVYINDSEVIITDIMTSNGVIHVIDAVLLPN